MLWSETYERQLEDVFAVQDDITRSIVETITQALQLGHLRGATPIEPGRLDEARAIMSPLLTKLPPRYVAQAHPLLGDVPAALDALERGYEERADWMYSIGTEPYLRGLHAHPQFVRLLERMGLGHSDRSVLDIRY